MDICCYINSNKLDGYKRFKEINGVITAMMKSSFSLNSKLLSDFFISMLTKAEYFAKI